MRRHWPELYFTKDCTPGSTPLTDRVTCGLTPECSKMQPIRLNSYGGTWLAGSSRFRLHRLYAARGDTDYSSCSVLSVHHTKGHGSACVRNPTSNNSHN